jgi:hypothetical protein
MSRAITKSTRETPETAASPTCETIIESTRPTRYSKNCSIMSGTNNATRAPLENKRHVLSISLLRENPLKLKNLPILCASNVVLNVRYELELTLSQWVFSAFSLFYRYCAIICCLVAVLIQKRTQVFRMKLMLSRTNVMNEVIFFAKQPVSRPNGIYLFNRVSETPLSVKMIAFA